MFHSQGVKDHRTGISLPPTTCPVTVNMVCRKVKTGENLDLVAYHEDFHA